MKSCLSYIRVTLFVKLLAIPVFYLILSLSGSSPEDMLLLMLFIPQFTIGVFSYFENFKLRNSIALEFFCLFILSLPLGLFYEEAGVGISLFLFLTTLFFVLFRKRFSYDSILPILILIEVLTDLTFLIFNLFFFAFLA